MNYKYMQNGGVCIQDDDGNFTCLMPFEDSPEWQAFLAIKDTLTIEPSDTMPDPVPTQAEQLDVLVDQAKVALATVSTLNEMKIVVAGVFDGMKTIYGTSS